MAEFGWTTFASDDSEGAQDDEQSQIGGGGEEDDVVVIADDVAGGSGDEDLTAKIMKVAALTGLTIADAQELLCEMSEDVHAAVELHFERNGSERPRSTTRPATAPLSRPENVLPSHATNRRGSDSGLHVTVAPQVAPQVRAVQNTDADEEEEEEDESEHWLGKIRMQSRQASEILRECEDRGELFTDPLFPAESSSLGGCTGASEVVRWCRPVETWDEGEPSFFHGAVQADDVVQGRAKDCWFLGALAIVASKPGMLQALVDFSWVARGLHAIRFFVEGEWVRVVVDDRVPCNEGGEPVFGRCKDPHHVWVQVVEKAFAKLCGSYGAMESGSEDDALVCLCGGSSKVLELRHEEEQSLWRRLVRYHDKGHLMGCANHGEASTSGSIEPHHAYSILSVLDLENECDLKLLQLRNPWGRGGWTGRFSPGSPSWLDVPPSVREMLGGLAHAHFSPIPPLSPSSSLSPASAAGLVLHQ